MTYKWAPGSRLTEKKAPAQVVGDTLNQLQQENGGRLTARMVVEAARPMESPIHALLEWDDLRAAELHRENEARHIIAAVRVVQKANDPKQADTLIHAYVNLTEKVGEDEQRAYVPMARVFDDADLLAQAIAKAAADLRACEARYQQFDLIKRTVAAAREQLEAATKAA